MLAFRSLDPFRALREPDRRRRDEERLSRSEQRTLSKTQNNHLTGKAPYKFESGLLQRGVCELSVPEHHAINPRNYEHEEDRPSPNYKVSTWDNRADFPLRTDWIRALDSVGLQQKRC